MHVRRRIDQPDTDSTLGTYPKLRPIEPFNAEACQSHLNKKDKTWNCLANVAKTAKANCSALGCNIESTSLAVELGHLNLNHTISYRKLPVN